MFRFQFDACDAAAAKAARVALVHYLEREAEGGQSLLQVEEIFVELISNVCKHADAWALVDISWQRNGAAVLEVMDHGPGLDLSQWQAPTQLSEHGRGLMIVSTLCDDVLITEGEGGRGTRIRAVLPLRRRLVAA